MTTFTWEQLEEIAKANVCRISYDGFRVSPSDLAAFAIALLDEKEKLEAERDEARAMKVPATTEAVMLAEMGEKVARTEAWAAKEELRIAEADRDRLREELREAEEAIRVIFKLVLRVKTGEPREAIWSLLKSFKSVASNTPAVRRARERKETNNEQGDK